MTFNRLLKIEIYKLTRVDFYLFVGLFIVITLALPLTLSRFAFGAMDGPELMSFFHAAAIKFMFFGITVAAAREFTNGVNRKRLLNGYKRHDLFISQLIIVGIYTFTLLVISLIVTLVLSLINLQNFQLLFSIPSHWILGFFLSTFAYGLFAVFGVNFFGRALWPILLFFLLTFVEAFLKIMGTLSATQFGFDRYQYFRPLELMDNLLTFEGYTLPLIFVLVGYLLVYQLISLLILKKIDI